MNINDDPQMQQMVPQFQQQQVQWTLTFQIPDLSLSFAKKLTRNVTIFRSQN